MEEDQPQEIFQSPPEYQSRLTRTNNGGGSAKRYAIIIVIIIVIALIILGVFKFFNGSSSGSTNLSPTPTTETFPTDTPSPTDTPAQSPSPSPKASTTPSKTPTPKPTGTTGSSVDKATGLDRAKLTVHVENGGGVAGAAKKAADYLTGLGYNVVATGNADNSNYTDTEIQVSSAKSDYVALLKSDLSKNYTVGKTSDTPPSNETADAVVIIGQ